MKTIELISIHPNEYGFDFLYGNGSKSYSLPSGRRILIKNKYVVQLIDRLLQLDYETGWYDHMVIDEYNNHRISKEEMWDIFRILEG